MLIKQFWNEKKILRFWKYSKTFNLSPGLFVISFKSKIMFVWIYFAGVVLPIFTSAMHIFRDKVISAIIISSYLFRMAHSVSASISGGVTLFFFYLMPWKIQPIRFQDYRCIFCGMQRVVVHSTLPSFLARNSLLGSIWGLLSLSTPANYYEHFRTHPEIVFEDLWTLPKIFRRFSKNFKKS